MKVFKKQQISISANTHSDYLGTANSYIQEGRPDMAALLIEAGILEPHEVKVSGYDLQYLNERLNGFWQEIASLKQKRLEEKLTKAERRAALRPRLAALAVAASVVTGAVLGEVYIGGNPSPEKAAARTSQPNPSMIEPNSHVFSYNSINVSPGPLSTNVIRFTSNNNTTYG